MTAQRYPAPDPAAVPPFAVVRRPDGRFEVQDARGVNVHTLAAPGGRTLPMALTEREAHKLAEAWNHGRHE